MYINMYVHMHMHMIMACQDHVKFYFDVHVQESVLVHEAVRKCFMYLL
jgi:hypothetical protein